MIVSRGVAVDARIRRGVEQEPDGDLLIIVQLHAIAPNVPHAVDAIHFHPLERCVPHIVGSLERPHLGDLNDIVGADPLRTEAAVVVCTCVGNILGLADKPLVAREAKNVEVLHLGKRIDIFRFANPF
jgi:hypothetical protein